MLDTLLHSLQQFLPLHTVHPGCSSMLSEPLYTALFAFSQQKQIIREGHADQRIASSFTPRLDIQWRCGIICRHQDGLTISHCLHNVLDLF
jgi:hypothetical protein